MISTKFPHEYTVKKAKMLLRSTKDPFIALLLYRATPLPWCGLSSAWGGRSELQYHSQHGLLHLIGHTYLNSGRKVQFSKVKRRPTLTSAIEYEKHLKCPMTQECGSTLTQHHCEVRWQQKPDILLYMVDTPYLVITLRVMRSTTL